MQLIRTNHFSLESLRSEQQQLTLSISHPSSPSETWCTQSIVLNLHPNATVITLWTFSILGVSAALIKLRADNQKKGRELHESILIQSERRRELSAARFKLLAKVRSVLDDFFFFLVMGEVIRFPLLLTDATLCSAAKKWKNSANGQN